MYDFSEVKVTKDYKPYMKEWQEAVDTFNKTQQRRVFNNDETEILNYITELGNTLKENIIGVIHSYSTVTDYMNRDNLGYVEAEVRLLEGAVDYCKGFEIVFTFTNFNKKCKVTLEAELEKIDRFSNDNIFKYSIQAPLFFDIKTRTLTKIESLPKAVIEMLATTQYEYEKKVRKEETAQTKNTTANLIKDRVIVPTMTIFSYEDTNKHATLSGAVLEEYLNDRYFNQARNRGNNPVSFSSNVLLVSTYVLETWYNKQVEYDFGKSVF